MAIIMEEKADGSSLRMTDDGTALAGTRSASKPNYNFKPFNLNQQLLMAPDLNDWLPDGHVARMISDTVEVMHGNGDLDPFYSAYQQSGQGAWSYDPKMMVGIILYGWSVGVVTTRKIARAIENDIGFRYLAGNQFPDFRTIGYFMRVHEDALQGLFDVVLRMCREAGLTKLGRVALDGRLVQGNASIERNRSADHIAKQVKSIVEEMRRFEAEEDELFGDQRGDELPDDLQDPAHRRMLMEEARKRLDANQDDTNEAEGLANNSHQSAVPDPLYSKLKNLLQSHNLLDEREKEWEAGIRRAQQEKVDHWEKKKNKSGKRPMSADEKVERERKRRFSKRKQAPATNDHPDSSADSDAEWEEQVRREQQEKIHRREEEQERTGKPPQGRPPLAPDERVKRERSKRGKGKSKGKQQQAQDEPWFDRKSAKINLTDPDTRPLKRRNGGWIQGFNDQTMVDPHSQIIVATDTVSDGNDKLQLNSMLERCHEINGCYPKETITDSGYYSAKAVADATPKTEVWSTTGKEWKTRKKHRQGGSPRGRIPNDTTSAERMERKLLTKVGQARYKQRYAVEAVQGQLSNRGFRRFYRRGLAGAALESSLWKSTNNLGKLFKAGKLPN